MWVKICANTNLTDALHAAEAGADAVGFVFAPSKRQVNAKQVRAITDRLPGNVERVGVFAMGSAAEIVADVEAAGLSTVQMHGGIDLDAASRLRDRLRSETALIHVVPWAVDRGERAGDEVRAQLATFTGAGLQERVLVDAKRADVSGGLGVAFDWARAQEVLREFPRVQVIVAGGLTPENVAEAVRIFRPFGVDVASGVELEPGRKDHATVEAFIRNARRA